MTPKDKRTNVMPRWPKRPPLSRLAFVLIGVLAIITTVFGLYAGWQAQHMRQRAAGMATAVAQTDAARQTAVAEERAAEVALQQADQARQTAVAEETAARERESAAQRQTRLAQARYLASQAAAYRQSAPDLALLLATHAVSTTYTRDSYTTLEAATVLRGLLRIQPRTLATLRHKPLKLTHTDSVNCAVYSPNGTTIVTASDDDTARLWDATTGDLVAALTGHTGPVYHAAFSPDGAMIVTASFDTTARVWDAISGELIAVLVGHTGGVYHAAFSPDGATVVTASWDDTARVWDATTGRLLMVLVGHTGAVYHAAFSPDGATIATASFDATARIWNAATGGLIAVFKGHTGRVYHVAFNPDDATIVTASDDATARLWDITPLTVSATEATGTPEGKQINVLRGHTGRVYYATYSPDGDIIVTVSDDATARLWDAATGKPITVLEGHTESVIYAAFSPDGASVVTVSPDTTARVWDTTTGETIRVLKGHTASVVHARYSPDGTTIVTAGWDDTARTWEFKAPDRISFGHAGTVWQATQGWRATYGWRTVLSSSTQEGVTGTAELSMTNGITTERVSVSDTVTTNGITTTQLGIWDAATAASITRLVGHSESITQDVQCPHCINTIAFSPSGDRFVTAGWDGIARIWQVPGGEEITTLHAHTAGRLIDARFDPTGAIVATSPGEHHTIRLWDATTGAMLHALETVSGTNYLDFSPDGRYIAAAGVDGSAWVWEVESGQQVARLEGDGISLIHVVFSPQSTPDEVSDRSPQHLAGAGFGDSGFIWDIEGQTRVATLVGHRVVESEGLRGGIWQIIYSPKGDWLATAGQDGTARVWDATTGASRLILRGHRGTVWSVAFSPDTGPDTGQIATGGMDGTTRLWNMQTGLMEAILPDHKGTEIVFNGGLASTPMESQNLLETQNFASLPWIYYVSYNPTGDHVVAAGMDGAVNVYVADTGRLLAVAQIQAPRTLTCRERVRFLHEDLDCGVEVTPTATVTMP